jgi:hypothetical protein
MPASSATIPVICIHPVRQSEPDNKSNINPRLPASAGLRSTTPSRYKRSSLSFCTSSSDSSDGDASGDDEDVHIIVISPTPPGSPSSAPEHQLLDARERRMKLVGRLSRPAGDARRELGLKAAVGSYKSRQSPFLILSLHFPFPATDSLMPYRPRMFSQDIYSSFERPT